MEATAHRFPIYRSGEINRTELTDTYQANYSNEADALNQYWASPGGQFGMIFLRGTVDRYRFDREKLLLEDFAWLNRVLLEFDLYQAAAHTAIVNQHRGRRSATYLDEERFRQNLDTLATAYHLPGVSARVPFDHYRKLMLHQYLHYVRQLARKGKTLRAMRTYKTGLSYATVAESKQLASTLAKLFR